MTTVSGALLPAQGTTDRSTTCATRPISSRVLIWTLVALAMAPLGLFGLLVAAQAVPDSAVLSNLGRFESSGGFQHPAYPSDGVGGVHDAFTECVALTYGLGSTDGGGLFRHAAHGTFLDSDCATDGSQIRALIAGKDVQASDYFRYWHGYSVVTRPLVATVGVEGLKSLVLLSFVAAGTFCAVSLSRRLGWPMTAALLTPVAASTNLLTVPFGSFTHAMSWTVILSGLGVTASATGRWGLRGALLAAAASAALFNYVDLLTTPAVPWAWTCFVAGATIWRQTSSPKSTLRAISATGVVWALVYAYTWSSKWVITAAVLGSSTLSNVRDQAHLRMSGQGAGGSPFGMSTARNVAYWWQTFPSAPWLLLLTAVVLTVASLLTLHRRGWRETKTLAVLCSPALIVPGWYEFLKNHSQVHSFFTYRSVPAAVGILLAAALLVATVRPQEERTP